MKNILVKGPALSRSGYGEQTRFALRALRSYEDRFNILLINIPWGQTGWINEDDEERQWLDSLLIRTQQYINQQLPIDIVLHITIPNEWEKTPALNVGYTAGIETDRVSPQWIEKANLMDKIIVVSNHSKKIYEETEYQAVNEGTNEVAKFHTKTPIEVVNYAVRDLESEKIDINFDYDFNFVTIAQMGPRKNLANTVKWFIDEFHDDEVGLLVKTNVGNCSTADKLLTETKLKELISGYPDKKCKIYLLHGDLTLKEMNYIYSHPKIKCYVTLTHGEGFGLPIFEAAYHGLPVIAPRWSGQNDFLHALVKSGKQKKPKLRPLFCRVDYTLQPIPQEAVWEGVLEAGSMWCYPSEQDYKKKLRGMFDNHSRYKSMANKLKKHIINNFTEETQYKAFVDAVYKEDEFDVQDWISNLDLEVHE